MVSLRETIERPGGGLAGNVVEQQDRDATPLHQFPEQKRQTAVPQQLEENRS